MSAFLNSDKYFKYHQAGLSAKDCPSSTVNTLKGGLCSLLPCDSPEKDTNSSASYTSLLSNLGRCFRCYQLGHWAKNCPLSAGINSAGGEGLLSSTNGISEKDVSATTSCITMSSNPDQCCESHQLWNQACTSSIGIIARGGLVSSDVLEKDTNASTSYTSALLISDKSSICNQPRHLFKDYHSTIGINARGEGSVSSSTSDIIEKESEPMSTTSNMALLLNSYKCFICNQLGHLAKDFPSLSDFNGGAGEGPISSTTHSENDFNTTTNVSMLPNWDEFLKYFQQGHWTKECPFSNGNNVGGGEAVSSDTCGISKKDVNSPSMPSNLDKCFKCQQPGHWAKDCPSRESNSRGGSNSSSSYDILNGGAREGPISSTSHSENDSNSPTNVTMLPNWDECFKCFQQGHWAKDCPSSNGNNIGGGEAVSSATFRIFKKDVDSPSMPSKLDKCFKCQQPGHWAKDCPSTESNSRGGPNSSSVYDIPQKICIRCGREPCVIRTSNTEKNPGRKFYKCPSRECGFFEWCDRQTSPSKDHNPPERFGEQQFTIPTYTDGGCRRIVKGYDLSTICSCGAGPCPVRTAKTQKNMDRQFVCCPVRKGEGSCGFFKWCDELDSAASPVSSFRNRDSGFQDENLGRNNT